MILLKSTSEILEIVTSSTAGIDVSATWVDVTTTTHSPSTTETKVTTATTTTIVAAPAASTQRQIKLITIRNIHASTSNTISVNKDISATNYTVSPTITLLAGELYEYNGEEWVYYAADGTIKSGAAAVGNTGYISAGTTIGSLGTIVFSNSNGVSFGANGQTITATVATNYQSQGAYLTTAMLSNAATISNINFSAGTTSNNLSNIVFSNSNGVSFGLNGSTVTAQHNAITTGRASNDAVGLNTAQTNVTWTVNSAGISLNAGGYLITAMASNAATISNINVSAGTTSNNLSAITFSNSNGISFGLNGSVVTAQHNAITTGRASNDGVGLNTAQTNVTWTVNSAGLSFNAGGYAGTTTGSAGGGISMSMTHNTLGLNISASVSQTNQTGNFYVSGNSTQLSSTAGIDLRSITFQGAGVASVGVSEGKVLISVPAGGGGLTNINISAGTTSQNLSNITFSNSNGVSFGLNGSTVTASIPLNATITQRYNWPLGNFSAVAAMGNGSFSLNRVQVDQDMSMTRMEVPFLLSLASSATANTWGLQVTVIGAIYTKNVSTLSSLSSASTAWSMSLASNSAGQTQVIAHAIRPMSLPINIVATPGEYYVGFGISTNTSSAGTATTALGNTWSVMGGPVYSSAVPWVDQFTATTNTSTGAWGGQGVYSAAISTVPPTVSISAINQTGSYYARGNMGIIWRNI